MAITVHRTLGLRSFAFLTWSPCPPTLHLPCLVALFTGSPSCHQLPRISPSTCSPLPEAVGQDQNSRCDLDRVTSPFWASISCKIKMVSVTLQGSVKMNSPSMLHSSLAVTRVLASNLYYFLKSYAFIITCVRKKINIKSVSFTARRP